MEKQRWFSYSKLERKLINSACFSDDNYETIGERSRGEFKPRRIWAVVSSEGSIQLCPGCFRSDDRGVGELGGKEVRLWIFDKLSGTPFFPKLGDRSVGGKIEILFPSKVDSYSPFIQFRPDISIFHLEFDFWNNSATILKRKTRGINLKKLNLTIKLSTELVTIITLHEELES